MGNKTALVANIGLQRAATIKEEQTQQGEESPVRSGLKTSQIRSPNIWVTTASAGTLTSRVDHGALDLTPKI